MKSRGLDTLPAAGLGRIRVCLRLFDDVSDLGFRKPGLTELGDSLPPVAPGIRPYRWDYYFGFGSS